MVAARWVATAFKEILRMHPIFLFVRPSARADEARLPVTKVARLLASAHGPRGRTRSALERQFKQPPPIFVSDDNRSTAGRRSWLTGVPKAWLFYEKLTCSDRKFTL
jgi:hypothetical protein